jgi:hypothetical protein
MHILGHSACAVQQTYITELEVQCVPLATEPDIHFWTTSCMLVK